MEEILLWGLTGYAWTTIAIIFILFGIMFFTNISADFVFLGGIGALMLTGVLTDKEAVAGFSDSSVVTIGVLFVVIAGLVHTGVIQIIAKKVLGLPKSYPGAIVRLMMPAAIFSSILSNTTVVVLFMKIVRVWTKKLGIAPSKLLIPLSYATGLGGCLTLIGTPPNLIISGMYAKDTGVAMNLFTPALPALLTLVFGVLSVVLMRKLLPTRKSPEDVFASTSEYTVEMIVPADNPHIAETVKEAGLTEIRGGHLIEIVRFDGMEMKSPVSPDEYIVGADRLVFSGQIDDLMELRKTHGFTVATKPVYNLSDQNKKRLVKATMVTPESNLIGKTLRESSFEEDNGLVVVAIARQGERVTCSPREITLRVGDTLLLEGNRHSKAFKKIKDGSDVKTFESEDIPEIGTKTLVSALIMLGMLFLSSFGVLSLLQSSCLAALAMLFTRCCSIDAARSSINWSILMIFAGSVCLGTAIQKTGIAAAISEGIMNVGGSNPIIVLTMICFIGTFITEFISNTAAAAMLYPIAYQSALTIGANPELFCVALMIATSSSFATPIGSPTHMLVYGPGGYRFSDFMKIGLPMNIIILFINIVSCLLIFPLYK